MKFISTVKSKIAVASTLLFVSASSFAADGATGGTDYAGEAMSQLLTQANDLIESGGNRYTARVFLNLIRHLHWLMLN